MNQLVFNTLDNVLGCKHLDIEVADTIHIEDRGCISATSVPEIHFAEEHLRACLHPHTENTLHNIIVFLAIPCRIHFREG